MEMLSLLQLLNIYINLRLFCQQQNNENKYEIVIYALENYILAQSGHT
jgi:hypothetical protein